jgi:hypothetical protein
MIVLDEELQGLGWKKQSLNSKMYSAEELRGKTSRLG